METLTLKIPLEFIQQRLGRPTWRDILFGLEQELLDPAAVPELAAVELDQPDPPAELIELVSVPPGASILREVQSLASREPAGSAPAPNEKWLYLVLAWLFEHRADLPDPLDDVETVYAEFDYPTEVGRFVRYMPSEEPDLGSRELNEARLVDKWERYLREQQERLAGR